MKFNLGKYKLDINMKLSSDPVAPDYWEGMYGDYGKVMKVIATTDVSHYYATHKYMVCFREKYWTFPYKSMAPLHLIDSDFHDKLKSARILFDKLEIFHREHLADIRDGRKVPNEPSVNIKQLMRKRTFESLDK